MPRISKHAYVIDLPLTLGSNSILGLLSEDAFEDNPDDISSFFKVHSECVFIFRLPAVRESRFFQILEENLRVLDKWLAENKLPLDWAVM